ncbi:MULTISPECIES: acyl-CoA dehydrogenase family protein [unclassified Streptomyces]|uniref:acyl-CoA dehydrogenase family protein n=1 Tax=unclassified Streptomyces TaxID=2593676 RepID=UPI0022856E2B|nr:acyl-CoA dehydrogenase family protein [Streptomyces sp. Je 1-369]WAL98660.1 acyl-CoA dehydrogenase family protein [Streptomyces sp. Je 1-369]
MSGPPTAAGELGRLLLPLADEIEAAKTVPAHVVEAIARSGALAAMVPAEYGGRPVGHLEYGELNRAVAHTSASLQSLLTVHGMVCASLSRWGSETVRQRLLPRLASGELIGAFGLTEDGAGSDAQAVGTTATPEEAGAAETMWRLDGTKRWLSFGQLAHCFLVFAKHGDRSVAFLVQRDDPGVTVVPSRPTSGFRSAMLADLHLEGCRVPADRMVGRPGFGVSQVAGSALSLGRLCVAYGSLGLAEACCDAILAHTSSRKQFGGRLIDLQLVRGLISDAVLDTEAARLLCEQAARAMDTQDDWLIQHVLTAKLAASRAADRASAAAAQLHGAAGMVEGGPVDRWVRDARVMQIIEGSTQLLQDLLAEESLQRFRVRRRHPHHPFEASRS